MAEPVRKTVRVPVKDWNGKVVSHRLEERLVSPIVFRVYPDRPFTRSVLLGDKQLGWLVGTPENPNLPNRPTSWRWIPMAEFDRHGWNAKNCDVCTTFTRLEEARGWIDRETPDKED